MKDVKSKVILAMPLLFFSMAFAFQNCSKVSVSDIQPEAKPLSQGIAPEVPSIPKIPKDKEFICSPFDSNSIPTKNSGLKTELRYLSQKSNLSVSEKNQILSTKYFSDNDPDFIQVPTPLYLADVNVPTRRFESGFSTSSGVSIKDNDGKMLIEYFALRMESLLQLGPNDPEGFYEIATISDDGTVLQIKEGDQWKDVISNDGDHSTQMGCLTQGRIFMTKSSRLPIRLYYNQGPRTQIANVLVWNYRGMDALEINHNGISDTEVLSYCGKADNENFWNSSTSQAGPWIQEVYRLGWKVLSPANFVLPNNETNPCAAKN